MRAVAIRVICIIIAGASIAFADDPSSQAKEPDVEESKRKALEERVLWRFEFDNDIVAGTDNAFTNGWGIQRHEPLYDTWDDIDRFVLSRWIAHHIPGIGDDGEGGRYVKRGVGFSQIMQTPEDITNPDPQPNDVPWAGVGGFHFSWSSFDNTRLNAFQIFVGLMGPYSLAEEFQTFIHVDLGAGDPPEGWDNQLKNEALLNLNYGLRRKVLAPSMDRYASGRIVGDVAVGGQVAVGNFMSLAELQLEFRWGWRMPPGFTHIPDPPGRGIMLDPSPSVPPDKWGIYFSLVPRYTYWAHIRTLEGGDTDNGGYHPGIDYDETVFQTLIGLHFTKKRFSFHITYFYFPTKPLNTLTASSTDWANFSIEYRF
jgi:lipid A 3-O-deacylase